MISRRLTIVCALACAWPVTPGASQTTAVQSSVAVQSGDTLVLSLSRVEELALDHHPFVGRARIDLRLAESRRTRARNSRWLPQLTLSNVWGPIPDARGVFTETGVLVSPDTANALNHLGWFTEANLELVQPLYTFGRLDRLIGAAEAGVQASEAGVEATSDEVRLQVRKVYWTMVLGQELVRISDEILSEIADADAQLNERYEEGSVSQNDLFEFEIYRFRANKGRREAIDALTMAEAALHAATGIDDGVPIRTATEGLTQLAADLDDVDGYLQMAKEARPELAQLRAGVAAQSSLARATRGEYYPQLFFGAAVRWNVAPGRFDSNNPFVNNPTNFFRPGFVVGFNWDANLFQTRDRVRIAEYEAARLSAEIEPLTERVQLDVREAYMGLVRATADVEDSERALTAADNWFRAEAQTFDLGIGEIKDLIDAFQAKIDMEREHLRSIFEFNTALADLSRSVGRDLYPN